ncbi:hypothetical protein GQ53DRAFT_820330 [Thozetella sp. PMI_491]|nr:hypothetical protein GQ53DRAFT_820330 [Thozetella sp. PMI_491]
MPILDSIFLGAHSGQVILSNSSMLPVLELPEIVDAVGTWLARHWALLLEWLSQPHVMAIIIAYAVTFTVVCTVFLCVGFGPVGIGAGTFAAAFQSYMYGGFTPAGGIFATLTSMAMLGILQPFVVAVASLVALGVAVVVWACGVGR